MNLLDYHIQKLERKTDLKAQEEIWNRRARTYGEDRRIFQPTELTLLVDDLVGLEGKRVLDIGSGTGQYYIEMTRLGAKVEGVELSPLMIEEAQTNLALNGLEKGVFHQSAWENFQTDQTYDLTFLCQSPALSSYDNLKKILALSKKDIILISNLTHKDSFFEDRILPHYPHHKSRGLGRKDIYHAFNILFLEGYEPEFHIHRVEEAREIDIDREFDKYIHWLHQGKDQEEDRDKLRRILEDYAARGLNHSKISRSLGLVHVRK